VNPIRNHSPRVRTPRESGPRERSASPPVNPLLHRLAPFAVGAVALVYQLPFFDRWFSVMDEGHMLQFADLIASGGMIYRDATSYPLPGAFYLLALVFRWFEPSILLSRWVVAIEFALFVPLVFLVIRRLLPLGWSLLAVGVLLLYRAWAFPHWQMYSYSTTAMLVLAASWVALVQFLASEDRRWLALSGLLFGLGVFCKQDYGAAMLLATIGTLVIYAHTGPAATRKPLLQLFATFLLPGAIVGAGAGLHFWLQGQLAFVIQLTVLNHFVGLASYDYQSFPSLLPLFQQDPALRTGTGLYNNFPALISTALGTAAFESTLVKETALYDTALKAFIYLPNLLIPAGALRLWHIRSEFPDPDTRTRALCETALFSVAAAFIILIRIYKPQDYVHLAVLYWPLLCLGVVYAHALLANRGGVRRGIAWLLLILLLGLSGSLASNGCRAGAPESSRSRPRRSCSANSSTTSVPTPSRTKPWPRSPISRSCCFSPIAMHRMQPATSSGRSPSILIANSASSMQWRPTVPIPCCTTSASFPTFHLYPSTCRTCTTISSSTSRWIRSSAMSHSVTSSPHCAVTNLATEAARYSSPATRTNSAASVQPAHLTRSRPADAPNGSPSRTGRSDQHWHFDRRRAAEPCSRGNCMFQIPAPR